MEFAGEFDPLCLTSGEFGGGLAEPQIAEAHVDERGERANDVELTGEELVGLFDAHIEDLGDIASPPEDFEGARLEACAVAVRAFGVDRGQEEQLDHDGAFSFAGRAASAGDVEGEPAGLVPALPGFGGLGEASAHMIEQARVGRHVRARGAADGFLVDAYDPTDAREVAGDGSCQLLGFVDEQQVIGFGCGFDRLGAGTEAVADKHGQCLADQAGLPRTRDTGDCGERAQGHLDADIGEVVAADVVHTQPPLWFARGVALETAIAEDILARHGLLDLRETGGGAAVEDLATTFAGAGSDVDEPVGVTHDVDGVFDDEETVAACLQPVEDAHECVDVLRVEAGGGLVEHVDDPEEVRGQLRGQPQSLQLPARQRRSGPIEREVPEPEVADGPQAVDESLAEADERTTGFLARVHRRLRRGDLGFEHGHEFVQRQGGECGDVEPGDRHGQGFGFEFLTVADRAGLDAEELSHPPLHPGALRVRERVEHILPGTDERPRIGRFGTGSDRFARLGQG